jgi:hypothetical protein
MIKQGVMAASIDASLREYSQTYQGLLSFSTGRPRSDAALSSRFGSFKYMAKRNRR